MSHKDQGGNLSFPVVAICYAGLSLRFQVARYLQQVGGESNSKSSFGSIFLLFSYESSRDHGLASWGKSLAPAS